MTTSTRLRLAALAGAAAISVAALAGCGSSSDTTTGASTSAAATVETSTLGNGATEDVNVYEQDVSTAVNESLGNTFIIQLTQSPSTGYTWKATGGTAAGSIVELRDDEVTTEGEAPGSPGVHAFTYEATGAGDGTLEFQEFPPGSDTASATASFEVSIAAP